jgi:hypothetical protein
VVPTARHFAVADVLGFEQQGVVSISLMRVLVGPRVYKLVATVDNETASEAVAIRLGIGVTTDQGPNTCLATPYDYVVATSLHVSRSTPRGSSAQATVTETDQPGFYEPAAGLVTGYCFGQQIDLTFASTVILPARANTELAITFPKQFVVTHDQSPPPPSGFVPSGPATKVGVYFPIDGHSAPLEHFAPGPLTGRITLGLSLANGHKVIWMCHSGSPPVAPHVFAEHSDSCKGASPPLA